MSIFKKLRSDDLDPKARTEQANEEINQILQKYNCIMDIRQSVVIVPLKPQIKPQKTDNEQAEEDYKKA